MKKGIAHSVISHPQRGKWGNSKYRGNTSGHVIKDLIEQFYPNGTPKRFVEVFSGGGTGYDVARTLGITNSVHLDLNTGWDALVHDIPTGADFVFSHPPYHDIVKYQTMRNNEYHHNDLSNEMPYEVFIEMLDKVNAKIYQSLINGGRHAFLVGDVRKKGKYYSIIKDMTWFGDLESHIIKVQHNCLMDNKIYANQNFIPIKHEHLLVFKKRSIWNVDLKRTATIEFSLLQFKHITWRDLVQGALEYLNGKADLNSIYQVLEGAVKARSNQHWKAKIRQTLQQHSNFKNVSRGEWALDIAA